MNAFELIGYFVHCGYILYIDQFNDPTFQKKTKKKLLNW